MGGDQKLPNVRPGPESHVAMAVVFRRRCRDSLRGSEAAMRVWSRGDTCKNPVRPRVWRAEPCQ